MIIISSKIRLDAMSKVISFSISDKYLEKLRTLYPSLTDNLAAKQFLTDRLDSSLGNSLDGSLDGDLDGKIKSLIESSLSSSLDDTLDDVLDDKLKTIIETSLDGILDERLDATVGKSLTSLSERMARLEERLDDSLDGRLDGMEPLTKEALRLDHLADQRLIDAIESELEETEKDEADYESDTSPLPNQETVEIADTVEPDSIDEPVHPAIGPVRGEGNSIESVTGEAVDVGNRQGLTNQQLHEKEGIPIRTIQNWANKIQKGKEITSSKYPKFFKQWRLNPTDSLWYEVD